MEQHTFIYALNGYAKKIIKAISKAENTSEINKLLMPFTKQPRAVKMVNPTTTEEYYMPGLGMNLCVYRADAESTEKPKYKTAAEALDEAIAIALEIKTQHGISQMHKSNARKELQARLAKINADRVTVASEVELAATNLDDVTHRSKMSQLAYIDMEIAFIEKTLRP